MIQVSLLNNSIRNGEVNTLAQAILGDSYRVVLDNDSYLSLLLEEMQAEQTALNTAILANRTKSDLNALLSSMKQAYRNFYRLILAYTELPSLSASAVAQSLLVVLERHHETITYKNNHAEVNSAITSLIAEINDNGLALLIMDNVDFKESFAALATAQENFILNYSVYKNARKEEEQMESASSIKIRLRQLINERLVLHLNAMLFVDAETYQSFALAVIAHIEKANSSVKVRTAINQKSYRNAVPMQG